MRVTRLEVFGFKSFLERLVLPLEGGITGVVGPNGCGKSNIVDALRWVLGETRASSLRGGVLEDVIFNGTDKLRPLGLAEVTLSLRPSEQGFFSDITSAFQMPAAKTASSVMPEQQAGESLQVVVANQENALSLEETPASKEGRPQLTVIEGALSQAAAPAECSAEADEGQASQEEQSADLTQAVLTRFAWLRSVEEVQVTRRLYRSGESEFFINRVPCRLKDIKDLFRAVGLNARAYTIVAQGEVSRIVTARPEERRLIIEEAAGVAGFRDRIATSARRLEETTLNLTRLDDVVAEVSRQVNALRVQAARARNREELRERIAFLEKSLFQDQLVGYHTLRGERAGALEAAKRCEAESEAGCQRVLAEEQEARGALMALDVEGDALRAQIDSLKEELEARTHRRAEFVRRLGEIQAYLRAREEELGALRGRRAMLAQRLEESVREVAGLKAQENELIGLGNENGEDFGGGLQALSQRLSELRQRLKEKEQQAAAVREKMISAEARLTALQEQIRAALPACQLKQALDGNGSTGNGTGNRLEGMEEHCRLFADSLSVPPHLISAVQAIIGERAAFLLAEQPQALARHYAESQKSTLHNQAAPAVLGVFRSSEKMEFAAAEPAGQDSNLPFKALLDLIEVSASGRLAAARVFKGVYLCADLEEALDFFDTGHDFAAQCTLVTSAGEVVTDYSFCSMRQERGLMEQRNEAQQLEAALRDLCEQQEACAAEIGQLEPQLQEGERQHQRLVQDNHRQQEEIRDMANRQGSIRGKLQVASRMHSQLGSDLQAVEKEIVEVLAKISQRQQEQADIKSGAALLADEDHEDLNQRLGQLREVYAKLDDLRRVKREQLSQLSLSSDQARQAREQARESAAQCSFEMQRLDMEIQNLREKVQIEYGEEVFASLEAASAAVAKDVNSLMLSEERRAAYREEATRLRARIMREGEVDSASIARYEEEKARLDHLTRQREDLSSAAATLKRTIEHLTAAAERRFLNTFAAVRDNFSKLVPRLFGGGKGGLELVDPARPLETGVDIAIRPPGKRLKNIDLLSGGEKALGAIALIFAMFICRPSPLCVLDEVDAPLDDANLVRFLSLVKEMSARTQFLSITHNKQSMATANNLVGVTMPQPGASKIVTVSLQEAYAHVA